MRQNIEFLIVCVVLTACLAGALAVAAHFETRKLDIMEANGCSYPN